LCLLHAQPDLLLSAVQRAQDSRIRYCRGVQPAAPFSEIAAALQNAFEWNVYIPNTITANVECGTVTLKGQVVWNYQRVVAERAARCLAGVVAVFNSITLAPQTSASEVEKQVLAALHRQAVADAKSIHIKTPGGTVTLTGHACSWQSIDDARNAAWAVPGVSEVIDQVMISMPS